MVGLRKFKCYRKIKRSYTRKSKYKRKSYVKSVPVSKVVRYSMGNPNKDYKYEVNLSTIERVQVRHNAIESARIAVVRKLNRTLGKNYHFQIRSYPHHILRENKMITGAGADRMQTGMQRSFGKAMGLAAQLKPNTAIFCVYVDKENMDAVRLALKSASPKLPCKCAIVSS